ncbi:MAG: Gfo/Idh/MocA family oxidoreductase, partial [Planctomycetes bacterium]|nr:Gfo/Idh/MocA family oxidoreductase [Planctomycetota bacterium]
MPSKSLNRRSFLTTTAAAASSLLIGQSAKAKGHFVQTQDSDAATGLAAGDVELRVALVGCGGRGSGAAYQALSTSGKVRLVAMADAFPDRLEGTHSWLKEEYPDKVDVPETRRFTGFEAYRKAIDCDVDVVVLATPPGFRPIHFEYAIDRGRHVFMEKPVAVDGPGI